MTYADDARNEMDNSSGNLLNRSINAVAFDILDHAAAYRERTELMRKENETSPFNDDVSNTSPDFW